MKLYLLEEEEENMRTGTGPVCSKTRETDAKGWQHAASGCCMPCAAATGNPAGAPAPPPPPPCLPVVSKAQRGLGGGWRVALRQRR